MLRRNLNSDFVGGAYVFPGGAVDPDDRHDNLEPVCEGRSDTDASRRLGIDRGGLAFWVAAIRESFEEAGLLLAYDGDGGFVDLDNSADNARWSDHRTEVDQGRRRIVELCEAEALRLAVDRMHYFGHWITPVGSPRRYDTRFFVTGAPTNQTPLHDDREVIANEWVRPVDGLRRFREGTMTMMPPTVSSLKAMARFESASAALRAATEIAHVPAVLPRIISVDGGMRIVLPGDPDYDGDQVYQASDRPWRGSITEASRTVVHDTPTLVSGATTGFGPDLEEQP